MANALVKTQIEQVQTFLKSTVTSLNTFLNNTTINDMRTEQNDESQYYEQILSSVRRLSVFCEEGLDACAVVVQNEPFSKPAAERTLYRIYHQCVQEFFSPKSDLWYEDSRSAYTGHNSIKFRQSIPNSFAKLISSLEGEFQTIREELEYYETDYRTKMVQSQ
ncbi:DUF3907 family protein [Bacillus sp. HMF5848]|uniref:YpuI family protein n=1 Tax=Bacillus sp. HMF5848 TaxID=2495421 RepID=UPI000F793889|nr:YpuI family protein [Bacillus sp. HMF5848]RSK27501.1 DUF3907 family protein [Bacillus sp. HMF5848]